MLKQDLILQIINETDNYVKKLAGLLKYELGGKIMTEFAALRPKSYSYITDDNKGNKKAKGTRKCGIKRKLTFEDYQYCLEANELEKNEKPTRK